MMSKLSKFTLRTSMTVFLLCGLLNAGTASAGTCASGVPNCLFDECASPATSAPQSLWGELAPTDGDEAVLPGIRDNTDFGKDGFFGCQFPYYESLDVEDGVLFMATNRGFQVWDVSTLAKAQNPTLVRQECADFASQHPVPHFPTNGEEAKFAFKDVDAPKGVNTVAATALKFAGTVIWDTSNLSKPAVKYADTAQNTLQVYSTTINGIHYVFAANALKGLKLYNMSRALTLSSQCVDNSSAGQASACPGVYLGKVGSLKTASYVDGYSDPAAGEHLVLVVAGTSEKGLEVWDVSNPIIPRLKLDGSGGSETFFGSAIWKDSSDGDYYLAVRGISNTRIYRDSGGCFTSTGSCTLANLALVRTLPIGWGGEFTVFLTYSESNNTPFLYFGTSGGCSSATLPEYLYDVSDPANPRDVAPPGYWEYYYRDSATGFNFVAPRMGKFAGDYFYRAGMSLFDVHRWTLANPNITVTCPSSGFLGEAVTCTAQAAACAPSPTGYNWTTNDGLTINDSDSNVNITWPLNAQPGTKTVRVTNPGCNGAQGTATVTINDPRPMLAGIDMAPATPTVCQLVSFAAKGDSGRSPVTYAWKVLDAGLATVANGMGVAKNTFDWATGASTVAGNYSVELRLTNASDPSGVTKTKAFSVATPAALGFTTQATFDGAPDAPIAGTVQFRAQTTGASKWTWNFGDGTIISFTNQQEGENPSHTYTVIGNYIATLTIENCLTAAPLASDVVQVPIARIDPLAILEFKAGCSFGVCAFNTGQAVSFTTAVTGNPDLYEYDWDGNNVYEESSATAVLSHAYNSVGVFTPRMRITRGTETEIFTHAKSLTISAASGQVTLSGPSGGSVGSNLTFVAGSTGCPVAPSAWTWTFPGGSGTPSGNTLSVKYSTVGQRTVTVQATNGACASSTASRTVTISSNAPPPPPPPTGGSVTANFTVSPASPAVGQSAVFNGSLSSGTIGNYSWNFGDGSAALFGATVNHTFAAGGTYQVQLTVSEPGCLSPACSDSTTKNVTVTGGGNPPPPPPPPPPGGNFAANFTFSPPSPQVGQAVAFNGTASTGTIDTYSWNFGDGGEGLGANIGHTYAVAGTYQVQLSVHEAGCGAQFSCFDDITKTLVVSGGGPPTPTITPDFGVDLDCRPGQVEICDAFVGQQIRFTDLSTITSGAIDSWTWSFADGTVDTSGPVVNHTFANPGQYNVILRVASDGVNSQKTKIVDVQEAPEPEVRGVVVPFAVQGQGALDQVTLVYIHNPDSQNMELILTYLRRPAPLEGDPGPVTLVLAPGETLFFPDVLQDPFGLDNVNGFLQVEPTATDRPLPVVFGFHRTFQEDGSSFGQGIPGVTVAQFPKSSDTASKMLHLTGLSDNSERLGFFGVTNPTDTSARFQLRFYNRLGDPIGLPVEPLTVSPFGQRQFQVRTIRETFGVANETDYRVDLELLAGGPVYPYATVLSLGSEDPTFIRASDPTLQKVFIIGALATAGLNNTQWQTDVVLTNVNTDAVATEVSFVNVGNTAEPLEAQRISLQQGETFRLENVLLDRWGLVDGENLGMLSFINDEVSQGPFPLIQAETYDTADPLRRFGQFMPAFTEADAAQAGQRQILTGLQQDNRFRTTIWVANPGSTPAEYDLIYRAVDGSELGRISGYRVAAERMRQINPGVHPLPFGVVAQGFTVQIVVRSGSLLSAAQVVINATNDPTYVPGVTR